MTGLIIIALVAVNVDFLYGQFIQPPFNNGGFPPVGGFPPNNGFRPNGPNAGGFPPNVGPGPGGFPPNAGAGNGNFPPNVVPGTGIFPGGPNPGIQPGRFPFPPGQNIPGGNTIISGNQWIYGTCYFNETGSNVRGRVDIRQRRTGGPCQVRVQVVGLPPSLMSDTEHGIHVHEYGDLGRGCYAAGPHYDSDSFSFHGSPNNLGTGNSHEGDMGNLRQSNAGVIDAELELPLMTLGGDLGIVGRAVVLHEGRDDLGRGGNSMSLQTGNAGAPIACCTIGYSDSSNWLKPFIPHSANFRSQFSDNNQLRNTVQGTTLNNQNRGLPNTQNQGFNPNQQFNRPNNNGFAGNFQGK